MWCTVTVGFPSQRACNVDWVSMLWRHNNLSWRQRLPPCPQLWSFQPEYSLRRIDSVLPSQSISPHPIRWARYLTVKCRFKTRPLLKMLPRSMCIFYFIPIIDFIWSYWDLVMTYVSLHCITVTSVDCLVSVRPRINFEPMCWGAILSIIACERDCHFRGIRSLRDCCEEQKKLREFTRYIL